MEPLTRPHVFRRSMFMSVIFVGALAAASKASEVGETRIESATPQAAQTNAGSNGVVYESFRYHRGAPGPGPGDALQPRTGPLGSWYGYGFAGKTHRWGWFGAEHYYPRVLWHRGYYRDHFRWSYRRGY